MIAKTPTHEQVQEALVTLARREMAAFDCLPFAIRSILREEGDGNKAALWALEYLQLCNDVQQTIKWLQVKG